MNRYSCLKAVAESVASNGYNTKQVSDIPFSILVSTIFLSRIQSLISIWVIIFHIYQLRINILYPHNKGCFSLFQIGLTDILHFIYKSRSSSQFTCPEVTVPYLTEGQRERLHDLYLNVHGRMHSTSRPLRILYKTTPYESILGWVSNM